jgi:hypothetical protein
MDDHSSRFVDTSRVSVFKGCLKEYLCEACQRGRKWMLTAIFRYESCNPFSRVAIDETHPSSIHF